MSARKASEDGVGEGFEGGDVRGFHAASDGDDLIHKLDVLHGTDHLYHYAGSGRCP